MQNRDKEVNANQNGGATGRSPLLRVHITRPGNIAQAIKAKNPPKPLN